MPVILSGPNWGFGRRGRGEGAGPRVTAMTLRQGSIIIIIKYTAVERTQVQAGLHLSNLDLSSNYTTPMQTIWGMFSCRGKAPIVLAMQQATTAWEYTRCC